MEEISQKERTELKNGLRKTIYRYYRDNKISKDDLKDTLKDMYTLFVDMDSQDEKQYDIHLKQELSEKDTKDLVQLWHQMVNNVIEFVNSHPDTKELLTKKKEKVTELWNKDIDEKLFVPEIDFYFSINGIEESLEDNSWNSGTDSAISLMVGHNPVLEMA